MDAAPDINDEQTKLWNGPAGHAWVDAQAVLDHMLKPLQDMLLEAVDGSSAQTVLDVGCGTGSTTLAAARLTGSQGYCLGVDVSEPMIAAARTRAQDEGSRADFLRADAQTHAFSPASFDVVLSRFGVMFFADPVAAFANLRRAARADAVLRFVAWRSAAENPFMTTAERAAAPLLPNLPARQPDAPGQFGFAQESKVRRILEASGWAHVDIRPIDVPCSLPAEALDGYLSRLGPVGLALAGADEQTRERVTRTVRTAFEPYVQGAEARFTAACWMANASAESASAARKGGGND